MLNLNYLVPNPTKKPSSAHRQDRRHLIASPLSRHNCFFKLSSACCFAQEYKVVVNDVTVMDGDEAVVPCTYEVPDGTGNINTTITWYSVREQGGQEVTQRLWMFQKNNPRNTFVDSDSNRAGLQINRDDGSLIVPEAKTEDNDIMPKLRCRVQFGRAAVEESDLKFLVVYLPQQDAKTALYAYQDGQEGFEMTPFKTSIGSCETAASFPEAKITYFKKLGDGKSLETVAAVDALTGLLDTTTFDKGSVAGTMITKKDLMKSLDETDHQAEFVCNVKISYEMEGEMKVYEKNYTMPKFNVNYETNSVSFEDEPIAILGETITLKCVGNGFPEPTIMLNGEEVSEKTIEVTADMDGSTYQCTAYNRQQDNAVQSSVYTVKVYSLKEPVVVGKDQIQYGKPVSVTCSAEGVPPPSVAWYKEDTKVSDDGTLSFENAIFENSAEYTCRADNGHKQLRKYKTFNLSVRGIILEGEAEVNVEGKKDESVTLECSVNSNPAAEFKWSDEDVASTTTRVGYLFTSTLVIETLTTELSEKTYTCTAENEDGATVTKTFKLPEIKGDVASAGVISDSSGTTAGIIIAILVILLIVAIILAVLYNKGIICKKGEKGEESAEGDIAVEINNGDGDVEAGNGTATAGAAGEETIEANEEEKLMNRENSD
uniref:basal cell adhesion molecule-like isoform X4 n=1 Tax=Styela clava TaxID=7725 RepID=UPI00193A300F|nr:basal cell adhesion molecule-like isoform X4 [Styela clava]